MRKRVFAIICTIVLSVVMLASCAGKETVKNVNLSDVVTAVKEAYGESYGCVEQPEEVLTEQVKLDKNLYEEAKFEMALISVRTDKFIAVKAKEGKGEEVEKQLNAYKDTLVNESIQYPMNVPMVQASEVVRKGDYVFYVLLGMIPDDVLTEGDDKKMAEAAKEQIKIGVDAIEKAFK